MGKTRIKTRNRVKQALANGETVYALWAHMGSAALCEAAVWAGFPVILLDNEHGIASLRETLDILRAVEGAGGELIVRVPVNDEAYIKKLLDIGVRGIMVPMVNNADEAAAAVAACLYPPEGTRSYAAPIVRASRYGRDDDYGRLINVDMLVILQIEHRAAVDNIEAIAAVDGVDVLFIGPNDLAGSIGKPGQLTDPAFLALYDDARRRILASSRVFGTITFAGRTARTLADDEQCRFIAGASDVSLFGSAARREATALSDLIAMIERAGVKGVKGVHDEYHIESKDYEEGES